VTRNVLDNAGTFSISGLSACVINVGVDHANRYCFDLQSSNNSNAIFESTSANGDSTIIIKNTNAQWAIRGSGTGAPGSLIISNSAAPAAAIVQFSNSGSFGFGPTSPVGSAVLHASSAGPAWIRVQDTSDNIVVDIRAGSTSGFIGTQTNTGLQIGTNNAAQICITAGGVVCVPNAATLGSTLCAITSVTSPQLCGATQISTPILCSTGTLVIGTTSCQIGAATFGSSIDASGGFVITCRLNSAGVICAVTCIYTVLFQGTCICTTGNVCVGGTLGKFAGSFVIPHVCCSKDNPNVYNAMNLIHGFEEGPKYGIFYEGEAKLCDGIAMVSLPEYFDKLVNRNDGIYIQLTNMKSWSPLVIMFKDDCKVCGNCFWICTTSDGIKDAEFDWRLSASRGDEYVIKDGTQTNHLGLLEVEQFKKYEQIENVENVLKALTKDELLAWVNYSQRKQHVDREDVVDDMGIREPEKMSKNNLLKAVMEAKKKKVETEVKKEATAK